jgi:hypothetical protein
MIFQQFSMERQAHVAKSTCVFFFPTSFCELDIFTLCIRSVALVWLHYAIKHKPFKYDNAIFVSPVLYCQIQPEHFSFYVAKIKAAVSVQVFYMVKLSRRTCWRSGGFAELTLRIDMKLKRMVSFTLRPLYPLLDWVEGWVDRRPYVDVLEQRWIFYLCQVSNDDSSIV